MKRIRAALVLSLLLPFAGAAFAQETFLMGLNGSGLLCCDAGQICQDGACITDCGEDDPCGTDQVCCEADQICYAGSCVVPM